MATVQILVPCYNYGRYLDQCVSSALGQEGVDVKILIIDDCSSDHTPEVGRALAARDSRIKFLRHEKNRGHIATYNEGIKLIDADYFVLLSADDCLAPGALMRATSLMETNPTVGMVYGQAISFSTDHLPETRRALSGTSIWPGERWIRQVCRSGKNFIICPETVVRSSVQKEVGGYDPALPHSGDMEMWLRIAAISDIGRVNGADQAFYRVHAQSMQRTIHAGFLFDLVGRAEAFRSAFTKTGETLSARDELHALAKQALALTAVRYARDLLYFPSNDPHPASDYRDFAVSLFPDIVETRPYQSLLTAERADRSASRTSVNYLRARCRKFLEAHLFRRIEFHWSRQTGGYFPRCDFIGYLQEVAAIRRIRLSRFIGRPRRAPRDATLSRPTQ